MLSHRTKFYLLLLVVLGGGVILMWFIEQPPTPQTQPVPARFSAETSALETNLANSSPTAGTTAATHPTTDELKQTCHFLQTTPDAKSARERLAELRAMLAAMPTNEAVAVIRQFLDSKAD